MEEKRREKMAEKFSDYWRGLLKDFRKAKSFPLINYFVTKDGQWISIYLLNLNKMSEDIEMIIFWCMIV